MNPATKIKGGRFASCEERLYRLALERKSKLESDQEVTKGFSLKVRTRG